MAPDTPAAAGNANSAGVIHDIGYRHYAGERRTRGYIRRSLFTDSLRGAYGLGRSGKSKVMPLLLLAVMCVPAGGMVAFTAMVGASELPSSYASYLLPLQVVISIFIAAQAPVMVSRDLRFGVMALYFSRPLERVDYVLGKYAAMAAAVLVLTGLPLVIMFAGALVVGLPLSEQVPDFLRAITGAAVLSLILAGFGLVIAAVTPRRGLAVAAIVTVLVVASGVQAVVQGIAISESGLEEGAATSFAYLNLLSPYTTVEGFQSSVLGAASPLPVPPGTAGMLVFAVVPIVLIALCFGALLLRYRSVSVS